MQAIAPASFLERIDRLDGTIGAMLSVDRERARGEEADSVERRRRGAALSPIDGMTVVVKANIAVAGQAWTAGIAAHRDRVAEADALCVARLRSAGAIIIGTANMDEGALGAITDNPGFGRTHNPHAAGYTAGGSSGGSAAAVASGFAVAALGTDTIGSVRIPASYCGVVGHLSAKGVIPVEGAIPLAPTLDRVGFFARSASECAAVAAVARGAALPTATVAGKRLAVLDRRAIPVQVAVADALASTARAAGAAGAILVPALLPASLFERVPRLLLLIAEVEGARIHADALRNDPAGFSPRLTAMLHWGASVGEGRYDAALAEVAEITAAAHHELASCDAILMPATPHVAFRFDGPVPRDQAVFTSFGSALGLPATAFPVGTNTAGLPIGMQVMAVDEALCLAFAAVLSDVPASRAYRTRA